MSGVVLSVVHTAVTETGSLCPRVHSGMQSENDLGIHKGNMAHDDKCYGEKQNNEILKEELLLEWIYTDLKVWD